MNPKTFFLKPIIEFYSGHNAFKGRMGRPEFWKWYFWYYIFSFIAGLISGIVQIILHGDVIYDFGFIGIGYLLAGTLPLISNSIKRMHDTGRSGWWTLVPFANIIILFFKSDGTNKYDLDSNEPENVPDTKSRTTRRNRPPVTKHRNTTTGSGNKNKYPEGKKNY